MANFSLKLNKIASDTEKYLQSIFLKQNNKSHLIIPMKYGVFSHIDCAYFTWNIMFHVMLSIREVWCFSHNLVKYGVLFI